MRNASEKKEMDGGDDGWIRKHQNTNGGHSHPVVTTAQASD